MCWEKFCKATPPPTTAIISRVLIFAYSIKFQSTQQVHRQQILLSKRYNHLKNLRKRLKSHSLLFPRVIYKILEHSFRFVAFATNN